MLISLDVDALKSDMIFLFLSILIFLRFSFMSRLWVWRMSITSKEASPQGYLLRMMSIFTYKSSSSLKWLISSWFSIELFWRFLIVEKISSNETSPKSTEKRTPHIEASYKCLGMYLKRSSFYMPFFIIFLIFW